MVSALDLPERSLVRNFAQLPDGSPYLCLNMFCSFSSRSAGSINAKEIVLRYCRDLVMGTN